MADKRKRTSSSGKQSKGGGLIASVVEQTTRLAGETTRIAGEMLDSAGNVATTARETGADWVSGVSPTAAEMLRPGGRQKAVSGRAARQPRQTAIGKTTAAGAASAARKTTKSAGQATAQAAKAASRATKQVARSTKKATSGARKAMDAKGGRKK